MIDELKDKIRRWEGEAVISRHDEITGTWLFIALHSSVLGMPVGGTRMRVYPDPAAALQDAMQLAEGMTYKWACLGIGKGGGKAVLAVPRPLEGEERRNLLLRFGELVESMNGAFGTGEDLGTTPEDMGVIGERTRFVHGVEEGGRVADPGPFTARGVRLGIEAAARMALGKGSLAELTVLVQGVGDVGHPLARELAEAGAALLVADTDRERARQAVADLGGTEVEPATAYDVECDVFAPCAVGAVINAETIPRLRCRLVAGSANNQLGEDADADRLAARGITYVPDYVINAGGALAFALHGDGEHDPEVLFRAMPRIGDTVAEILQEAAEESITPLQAAHRRAQRAVEAGRQRRAEG